MDQFDARGCAADEVSLARTLGVRFRQQVHTRRGRGRPGRRSTRAAGERILERFVERYGQVYGEGALLLGGGNEVELHRVVGTRAIEPVAFPEHERRRRRRRRGAARASATPTSSPTGFIATRVYDGDALRAGNVIDGPGDHRAHGRQRRRAAGLPRRGRSPADDPARRRRRAGRPRRSGAEVADGGGGAASSPGSTRSPSR